MLHVVKDKEKDKKTKKKTMTKDNGKERKKTKGNTKTGNLRQSNLKCTALLQTSAPLHTLNNPVLFAGRGPI